MRRLWLCHLLANSLAEMEGRRIGGADCAQDQHDQLKHAAGSNKQTEASEQHTCNSITETNTYTAVNHRCDDFIAATARHIVSHMRSLCG